MSVSYLRGFDPWVKPRSLCLLREQADSLLLAPPEGICLSLPTASLYDHL